MTSATPTSDPKAYRLPTTVRPRHYTITLDARPGRETFSGSLTVQVSIAAPTNTIELHARDLDIANARLTSANGQTFAANVVLDAEREIAVITLDGTTPTGGATLTLDFTGRLSPSLEGLFLSKDGPDEMLCTQCEATGARAIIPCWDEPTFKATFAWTVTTAPGQTVLTNGKLLGTDQVADGVTWRFAPTKPMASYLIALAIGEFASTPEQIVNGIPLRIWALKGKEPLGAFAQTITEQLLPFYEDYFAIPYHFDKLDNLGVPNFGAGAMENAGLIISQAVVLLLDEQAASRRQELIVAEVTAHEFAHMWFGDLVTMRWWDDLWLNEAFASWMAYHAIDTLRPQYRVWDEVQGGADAALAVDSLTSSHPIYNPVATPRAVMENFDTITYEKGGAVLRMVHDFLGDEAFRAGLRAYMQEFAEGNATGADLWRHLQQASNQPVSEMMESWILQAGHPLIDVSLGETGANGETQIQVSQRRFYSAANAPASDQLWQVPMQVRYEDAAGVHTARYLLTERSASFSIPVSGELRWLYANAGEIGFYRQRLDAALLAKLRANLNRLSPAEQKGLLRDQWALVSNGDQAITPYLDTVAALSSSDDETLVGQIVGEHLSRIENLVEISGDAQAMAGFRAWVARLFRETMARLGYEPRAGEPVETSRLRASVLSAMANDARDAEAIAQARAWQEREASNPAGVDPNLAPIVVGATARAGDAATYDRFLTIYQARKGGDFTPDQVERYAGTFALFEPADLTARTVELMGQGEDTFPFQTQLRLIVNLIMQPSKQRVGWDFVTSHWDYLQQRAPFLTPRLVEMSGILPDSMRAEVVAFWDAQLKGEFAGPYARALEQMDQNTELRNRTRGDLLTYFTK
ncbi:MAG TPA: M1 family metallopeptidase [Ktedonobacterales bacterium]|jgi:puromycin-sensitive aminopeptidase|nr:M1 family metallopeptidase [Ktedonobacterales bacterium]